MFSNLPSIKHVVHSVIMVAWIYTFYQSATQNQSLIDPFDTYGVHLAVILIAVRLVSLLAFPQTLLNGVALLLFDTFRDRVKLKATPLEAPFICVRVVTRGLYPKLVDKTVRKNLNTLLEVGCDNFVLQVVTDCALNLPSYNQSTGQANPRVKEVVVPPNYATKTGALNKSRALQYCWEPDVNVLNDTDWIVHLDEETLLTENAVRGILNFVSDSKHQFGQGMITYAHNQATFHSWVTFVQNRICTVADSFRVTEDLGKIRGQFRLWHKPIFGMKGSYVVTQAVAERTVSFDNGLEGSTAEDAYIAISAMDQGYTFDFIEGEMWERSPFTFSDFFKQRKRWMQGIYLVASSSKLSLRSRFFLAMSLASWLTMPITTSNVVLAKYYPFHLHPSVDLIVAFMGAMALYMYAFGYLKQHPVHRYSWIRLLMAGPEIILASSLSIVAENLAVLTMWFGNWYEFYIVQKESDDEEEEEEAQKDYSPTIVEHV